MSRHLLYILDAIDRWKWLNYSGTTNYSPIKVCVCVWVRACVVMCICTAFRCLTVCKSIKSSFFMQNKTALSLDDESINNSDALLYAIIPRWAVFFDIYYYYDYPIRSYRIFIYWSKNSTFCCIFIELQFVCLRCVRNCNRLRWAWAFG